MAKTPRIYTSDKNPVGMIVPSMLTESQFQALNGTTWILADGRSVAGSKYATVTGNTTAPDCRGLALRGKNNGRSDGNQNPDGDSTLGTFQSHATARPTANFVTGTESATHTHAQFDNVGGTGGSNLAAAAAAFSAGQSATTSTQSANHTHTITSGGDNETRMKNITVNYFIKIND